MRKYIFLIVFFVSVSGCSGERETGPVDMIVGDIKFSIPRGYLSNRGDLEGGVQSVVTVDFLFPSMAATEPKIFREALRSGDAIRVLLSAYGIDPEVNRASMLKYSGSNIIAEKNFGDMILYETVESNFFDYYFMTHEGKKAFFRCSKETGVHVMCSSGYNTEVLPGVFADFIFLRKSISNWPEFHQKTKKLIISFKREIK